MRWVLPLFLVLLALEQADAQGLMLEVKRDGPKTSPKASAKDVYYGFTLRNMGQEKFKDLRVHWILVVDDNPKSGPKKFIEGEKIISSWPGDVSEFKSTTINVNNQGHKPTLDGYSVKIYQGEKLLMTKSEPDQVDDAVRAYEKLKAQEAAQKAAQEAAAKQKAAEEAAKKPPAKK